MKDIAFFQFSTEEDLSYVLEFTGLDLTGRDFEIKIKDRASDTTRATLTNGAGINVSFANVIEAALPKADMAGWPRGEYTADVVDITSGIHSRIMAVRFMLDLPGRLVQGVKDRKAYIQWGPGRAYVTSTGAIGPAGPRGPQGDQGEKGDAGDTGPQGEKGDTGDAGAAATVAVGDVTTGAPEDPASVTNSGTPNAAVFDFVIPKGDKGDKGDQGPPGTATIGDGDKGDITVTDDGDTWRLSPGAYASQAESREGTNTDRVASPFNVADHVGFNLGITRAQISTRHISVNGFQVTGETTPGDIGAGALYVRGTSGGLRAVQDAAGTWWNLAVHGDANVGHFGAKGDGVADDTAALQLAIDTVCPFLWQGSTRATELNGRSGAIYLPKGIYRVTATIRLAPNLTVYGDGTANDWTVRSTATGDNERYGSAIVSDISVSTTYAIDTAPYNASGVRQYSSLSRGLDSYNGIKTEVHGITLKDLSLVGNWNSKGLNMAGAVKATLENVVIYGFHVGIRWSASWYSSMKDVRIFASWKGIMTWYDVTDLSMYNVSINKPSEAPAYSDTVDGALPPTDAWWSTAINNMSAGIVNYYSNVAAYNLTVEGFACYSHGYNAVNDFQNVYIEGIGTYGIVSKGPDQQHERHKFDTLVSNSCDLILCSSSRLEVEALNHNYTQGGFNRLLADVVAPSSYYLPVIKGLQLNGTDVFSAPTVRRSDVLAREGSWSPVLRAGGASLGAPVAEGRWWRVGNLVTVTCYLTLPTKGGATGALDIDGLPFSSIDRYGSEWSSVVAFGYNVPGVGTALRLPPNAYAIEIPNKTHADVVSGADLRFSLTYMTDNESLW